MRFPASQLRFHPFSRSFSCSSEQPDPPTPRVWVTTRASSWEHCLRASGIKRACKLFVRLIASWLSFLKSEKAVHRELPETSQSGGIPVCVPASVIAASSVARFLAVSSITPIPDPAARRHGSMTAIRQRPATLTSFRCNSESASNLLRASVDELIRLYVTRVALHRVIFARSADSYVLNFSPRGHARPGEWWKTSDTYLGSFSRT